MVTNTGKHGLVSWAVPAQVSGMMLTEACVFMGLTKARFGEMLDYSQRTHVSRALNGRAGVSPKYAIRALHLMTLKARLLSMEQQPDIPQEVIEGQRAFLRDFHLNATEYWRSIGL